MSLTDGTEFELVDQLGLKLDVTGSEITPSGQSFIIVGGISGSNQAESLRLEDNRLMVSGSVFVTSGTVAITDNVNGIANIENIGTRKALAVEYPILLDVMQQILTELKVIRRHMQSITEEEWGEDDDI